MYNKNMKKKAKLTLVILLLIAVALASFGIFRIHKGREAGPGSQQTDLSGDQADQTEQTEQNGEESGSPLAEDLLATLFFASDYQEEPGFDTPAVTLGKILDAAKADGKDIDKAVICRDFSNDRVLNNYQIKPDDGIAEVRDVIKSKCAKADAEDMIFVQGNHDMMSDQITPTGLYEFDDYLIFVLNTEDFPWLQGKTSGCLAKVRESSAAMRECFEALIRSGETRPVFIAGHVPLHFTARTSSRHTTGDNLYSSLVFDAVNDAAQSLDII